MFKHSINLYRDSNLLDDIIVEGLTRHQAVLESDLNDMQIIVESQLIAEKVYSDGLFSSMLSHIETGGRFMFTTSELSQFFPLRSSIHKTLKRHNQNLNKLYVSVCYFSIESLFLELKHWTNGKVDDSLIIEKCNEMKQTISNGTSGAFVTFKGNDLFGIMFLNESKLSVTTLKHEFIHYYMWMKGDKSDSYSADENMYASEFDLLNKYFSVSSREFQYVTNDHEYETLLNDFLSRLKTVKYRCFSGISGHEFARKISSDLLKDWSYDSINSNEEYLKKLSSLRYVDDLKSKASFIMVVVYNMLDEKRQNIKNHIFGAFHNK